EERPTGARAAGRRRHRGECRGGKAGRATFASRGRGRRDPGDFGRRTAAPLQPPRMARVSVIIPAFNEERTIAEVVRRVRALRDVHEIVVVDDGSTDRTSAILAELRTSGTPPLSVI